MTISRAVADLSSCAGVYPLGQRNRVSSSEVGKSSSNLGGSLHGLVDISDSG